MEKKLKININSNWFILLLFTICTNVNAQESVAKYPIIPYPTSLTPGKSVFVITPATVIILPAHQLFKNEAGALNHLLANSFGRPLKMITTSAVSGIRLKYDASITNNEGYKLVITPKSVSISAKTSAGMFMGIQTIRQLLPVTAELSSIVPLKSLSLPTLSIYDEPAYTWRGMHLDVARHFFSISYLEKFIDVLALYKFNKFHLHLTDDQGWRIEIKKYPKLTEYGAWRTFNSLDTACMKQAADNPDFNIDKEHIIQKDGKTLYGGFYTQAQMKALVAYAAAKHVDIIPEIDMPGHMMAAISQYPYLACDSKVGMGQTFSAPICPCQPSTFQFAQDVYSEIMDIFPSEYLHIGGDEVDRSLWAKSAVCKDVMKKEGLRNTAELQSYFINNMEKFFISKGRKLIGWDEVLEGGISSSAVVMYWRTWVPKAPIEAAKNGNKVIMTPENPLYFSVTPNKNSLPSVYHFNIIPKGLTDTEAKNIIGAQANIWTEYIPSKKRADYMYMPRMTALAEVLWTNHPDYPSYLQRLNAHYGRLDILNVNYRLPDLTGFLESNVFTDQDTLHIGKTLEGINVRYTTDGTSPTIASTILNKPIIIRQSQQVKIAAFKPNGHRGDVYDARYEKQALAEPQNIKQVSEGLICKEFKDFFKSATLIPDTKPDAVFNVKTLSVPKDAEAPSFGLKYRGYLDIPEDGIYSFYLTCDDGCILKIAGRDVVNNDGLHSAIEKNGQVALKKGLQTIALDFIEGGGGYALQLKYSLRRSEPHDIPAKWLKN